MDYAQQHTASQVFQTEPKLLADSPIELRISISDNNKRKVSSLLDPRQEAIREKLHVAPSIAAEEFLSFIDRGNPELRGRYFGGKTVLDLGGGFGGLPWLLEFYAKHVTVVDPIFADDCLEAHLDRDLKQIAGRIDFMLGRLRNPNLEERIRLLLKNNVLKSERISAETKRWKDFDPEKHRNISRNSSFGENLEGIADQSQDVIFLNHIITKDTVRIPELFSKIGRVIAPGGCVFVSNVNEEEEKPKIREAVGHIGKSWSIKILEEGKFIVMELRK